MKTSIKILLWLVILSFPWPINFRFWFVPASLAELLIAALLIIWGVAKWRNKNLSISFWGFKYPVALIFVGLTLSVAASDNFLAGAGVWKSWFVAPIILFIILADVVKRKEELRAAIWALVLSGGSVSLAGLWYFFAGILTYDGRLAVFYPSPNYLAMQLAPILALVMYLFLGERETWKQAVLILFGSLTGFVLVLTFSFGAFGALLAAAFFLFVFSELSKQKKALLIASAVLLLVVLSAVYFSSVQKTAGLESRLAIWRAAWAIGQDHMFFGIGPQAFQSHYLAYQGQFSAYPEWAVPHPHNLLLAFWLQAGLTGLIGFIWLLLVFFRAIFKAPDRKSALFWGAAVVIVVAHGLVDTTYWRANLAITFWLILALGSKAGRLRG